MAFSLSMRDVPYVRSYNEAVNFYDRCVPWRDGSGDRPLLGKRHRNSGVRMIDHNEDVVFRYDRTDVVTWHKNGACTINNGGWGTVSTCAFATRFAPTTCYLSKNGHHLVIDSLTYPIAGRVVTVSGTGEVSGPGLGVFAKDRVNRKRAKALLASLGYPRYADWYRWTWPMMKDAAPRAGWGPFLRTSEIEQMLQVESKWLEIMMSSDGSPAAIRRRIYGNHVAEVYDETRYDTHQGHTDMKIRARVER